ncbi:MAG: septal ring lytic transglycosylase RlpA family protein [Gammaproteobacteria bacterium]|nr:septal ring lytic transglycosylase RlpA family protein [Gammaproteobacteria bacterium]
MLNTNFITNFQSYQTVRKIIFSIIFLTVLDLVGCSLVGLEEKDGAPQRPIDLSLIKEPIPKDEPRSKYGNPETYKVLGNRYYTLKNSKDFTQSGLASWYGTKFHGKKTSSGEPYDMYALTGAHRTLPLPTYARITNLDNNKSIIVKINDRGPFHSNRIVDLSYAAASKLGVLGKGTAHVELTAIDPKSYTQDRQDHLDHAKHIKELRQVRQVKQTKQDCPPSHPNKANHHSPSLVTLQIGSFQDRKKAQQLINKANRAFDHPVKLHSIVDNNKNNIYRVHLGPFPVEHKENIKTKLADLNILNPITVLTIKKKPKTKPIKTAKL